jgi:hypothetical protein
LQIQSAEVELGDRSRLEVVGKDVIHQDAVVGTEEAGEDCFRSVDAGVDAAEEFANGWEPAVFQVREEPTGIFEDREGDSSVELGPVDPYLQEVAEFGR